MTHSFFFSFTWERMHVRRILSPPIHPTFKGRLLELSLSFIPQRIIMNLLKPYLFSVSLDVVRLKSHFCHSLYSTYRHDFTKPYNIFWRLSNFISFVLSAGRPYFSVWMRFTYKRQDNFFSCWYEIVHVCLRTYFIRAIE